MSMIIGVAGATIILAAFIMNQLRYWKNSDIKYDVANFAGGILLVVYAVLLNSPPFAVLNLVWAAVSLRDIVSGLKKSK